MDNKNLYESLGLTVISVPNTVGVLGKYNMYVYKCDYNYYHTITCRLPLKIAEEVYKSNLYYKDVRAGGHGYFVEPSRQCYWESWSGKRLVDIAEEPLYVRMINEGAFPASIVDKYKFARPEDYAKLGEAFVESYHIDSDEALSRFIKGVLEYN